LTGFTGPTGFTGFTGPQGLVSVANWAATNNLITSSASSTVVNANTNATFNGTTLAITGNITTTSTTSNQIGGVTLNNGALSGMSSLLVPSYAATASTVYAGSASPNTTITSWGDGSGWKFNFLGNTARTSNVLTLVDNGYVGINCNTPQTALDVNGSGRFYATASTSLYVGNSTGAYFAVATGTGGYAGLLMNGYFQVASNGGTSTILFSVPSDTGGNVYWNGTGNFGIGTSSPATTLDVNGNTNITGNLVSQSGQLGNLGVNSASTTSLIGFNASNQAGIYGRKGTNNNYSGLDFVSMINTVRTTVMTVSPNSASVGIGTTSPGTQLEVALNVPGSIYIANTGGAYVKSSSTNNTATAFGTGNFTIEFWVYHLATSGAWQTWFSVGVTNGEIRISANQGSSGYIGVLYPPGNIYMTSTTAPVANTWKHVALVRNSGTMTLYYDGVSIASATGVSFTFDNSGYIWLGYNAYLADTVPNAYIGGLRITKAALYTTTFTPDVPILAAGANTSLLMNMFVGTPLYDSVNNTAFQFVNNCYATAFVPNGTWSTSNTAKVNGVLFVSNYVPIKTNSNLGTISIVGDMPQVSGAEAAVSTTYTISNYGGGVYGGLLQGTGGYLAFSTIASGTATERMRIKDNGYVGINCNAPAYMLDVNGTFHIVSGTSSLNYDASLRVGVNSVNDQGLYGIIQTTHPFSNSNGVGGVKGQWSYCFIQNGCNVYGIGLLPSVNKIVIGSGANVTDGAGNGMTIDTSNGRVGIANSSPAVTLDVSGIIRGSNMIVASAYAQNAVARIVMGPTTTTNYDYCSLIQSRCTPDNNYGSYLSFWTHGGSATYGDPTERMTIDSSGNVGIGTTSPGYTLDVNGSVRATSPVYASAFSNAVSAASIYTSGNDFLMTAGWMYTQNQWQLRTKNNGGSDVPGICFSNGNVGVNTGSPAYQLDVNGTAKITDIRTSGALILTGTSNYHLYNDGVALIAQTNGSSVGYAKLAYGAGSWQSISDLRVKNVLSNITGATEALSQITPVYYTFKGDPTNKRFVGVIAQEVQQHYPELVDVDPNPDKMITLSYSELVAPLIVAVKELSARLSNVEAKLAATTGS
jgi:hypothetical protein